LDHPALQILVLLVVFLPMRFCNLGAAVLALSLAFSGWHPAAVAFTLIAAPVLSISQLKLMKPVALSLLGSTLAMSMIAAAYLLPATQALVTLPESVNLIGLFIICLLFGASLLRLGPRKFLRRLLGTFSIGHSHEQDKDNGHGHAHKPTHAHHHGSDDKPHHH
jgi:hypothetical protein